MRIHYALLTTAVLLAPCFCPPARADVTFTLDPVGGAISGYAGQTIGWGFTIVNDTNFAVITSSEYTDASIGSFSDFISSVQYQVIGPTPETMTWSQTFDAGAKTGVGQFTIDPLAAIGAHSVGVVQLTYDLYSVDPNDPTFDPGADLLTSGKLISAAASIDVTAAPSASAPEPDLTREAILLVLALVWWVCRKNPAMSGPGSDQARENAVAGPLHINQL